MDIFGLINIPTWIPVFIVIFYICYMYMTWNHGVIQSLGVPCPNLLPIIGNSIQELIYVVHDKDIENGKKYGRIYGQYELTRPTLRVSDPEIIKEVLVKQFNNFVDRRKLNLDMFDSVMRKMISLLRGEEWKKTRNVMSPTFTSGKLKQMIPLMDKCCERFVEILGKKADSGESIDAKTVYISYLLEIVGTCAFGIEMNTKDQTFINFARKFIFTKRMIDFFLLMVLPRRLLAALGISVMDAESLNYMKTVLTNVIRARESGNERRNDFLQVMLDAVKEANTENHQDDSENQDKRRIKAVLTPEGVLAQSCLFLTAGFESASTTLSYISYNAAINQECQDKLINEIDSVLAKNENKITWDAINQMTYMDMFILETLRLYPPGIRLDRECRQETKIGDLRIPKGFTVVIPAYAIHHDEEFYPDPYKFDPERFTPENKEKRNPYTYLAFGAGPRNCIGMRFAVMELKMTLIHVLKDFRFCRCPDTQEPIVFARGCFTLTAASKIQVKLMRR